MPSNANIRRQARMAGARLQTTRSQQTVAQAAPTGVLLNAKAYWIPKPAPFPDYDDYLREKPA